MSPRNPTYKGERRQRTLRLTAAVDDELAAYAKQAGETVNSVANSIFELVLKKGGTKIRRGHQ